jgi:hypothetical protein
MPREAARTCAQDVGTVYFNESAEEAKGLVSQTLGKWDALLATLAEAERGAMQRSMGLKMEQLKAEVQGLDHLHDDD